tara:strand:- start:1253 stop:1693 length:441 start_codon:yes stop_codon:yes gene_type:complete
MDIVTATTQHLSLITPIFNQYRVFYGQADDVTLAESFLKQRLENQQSVIFLAIEGEKVVGFTQLYPTFSSVSAKASWILNDLFVLEEKRGCGIGRALLKAAKEHALVTGAKGLALETGRDNLGAQKLYESEGYKQETEYLSYYLSL